MLGLYLKTDSIIFVENQKKGLCLISAFFQAMGPKDNKVLLPQSTITSEIWTAMKYVSENVNFFTDLSPPSYSTISLWTESILTHVANGGGLKPGQFWNIEILEKYIELARIPLMVYYYLEVCQASHCICKCC